MNDNAQQSTCPVRGLTLAGQALVNKLKEEHSLFIKETVEFFMANDIITLDDVLNLTEEALMNKILKQVHPYSVYYSESDMRWHTYLKDDTQLSGRKPIARKKKSDLEKFLLKHYQLQLNTLKTYTFENLYVEFMKYKEATQSKSTVNAYIKAYKRFYMNDPIIKEDLSKIAVLFTFQTRLRISEVVALKWQDVNFVDKTIRIARFERVQQEYTDDFEVLTKCQHIIIDSDTKGEFGERIVDLTDDALYILELLKEYYESENLVSEWLFINKNGRIHNRAMDLRIRRYCRLAGINEKSLHKIRSIQKICILSNKKITKTLYLSTFPHLLNNSERGIRSTLRYGPR